MRVFATTICYALGKQLGMQPAAKTLRAQLENPTMESLPCVRTIARLRELVDVQLRIDTGGTLLGKTRSEHFSQAMRMTDCDAWVSIDDDVECTLETLDCLLGAVCDLQPRAVAAPCAVRGENGRSNVVLNSVVIPRTFPTVRAGTGGRTITMVRAGFALNAINRAALRALQQHCLNTDQVYVNDQNETCYAAFHEFIRYERWYGEDHSFWTRMAEAGVQPEALTRGYTFHDGAALRLEDVEQCAEVAKGKRI